MKRTLVLLVVLLLILAIVVAVVSPVGRNPDAPRFVPGAPSKLDSFAWDHYEWDADAPFEGGRVWLWTAQGTNYHSYLFDLSRREILGELFNAGVPELCSRDGSRVLVRGLSSRTASLKEAGIHLINAACRLFGRPPAISSPPRNETFWLLSTTNNAAVCLGDLSQLKGAGSRWHPSPDFRRGYTVPSTTHGSSFVLCDLEAGSLTQIPLRSSPIGWWDESRLLTQNGINRFELFDVDTRNSSTLLDPAGVSAFLAGSGLTNDPGGIGAIANWNGREYDFYFGIASRIHGLQDPRSFVLKANRSAPTLRLLYPEFEFHWGASFDPSGTLYLNQGESGAPGNGGNGAVYLRNLTNGLTLTLVPPDAKGQYAIPRFYDHETIYFRDRLLRRVELNGSNDMTLLPGGGP